MALNYTFSIIKPDAFNAGKAGKIIAHLEAQGFTLKSARVMQLTKKASGCPESSPRSPAG